jgi:hypothetical protein
VEARVEVSVAAQVEAAGAQVAALALAGRVAEEGSQVVEAAGPEPAEAKAGHPEEGLAEEPAERAAREGRGEPAGLAVEVARVEVEERAGREGEAITTHTRIR